MGYSAGVFTFTTSGIPVVTSTSISSTVKNTQDDEIEAALSTCDLKDGTQVWTANRPTAGFILTGLGAGSANGHSLRYQQVNGVVTTAGDILYATAAGTLARLAIGTARQILVTNAGATAPSWATGLTAGTEQATTSGTSIDFTGIPSSVRRITVQFVAVSTNGIADVYLQIGDAGGIEATGYSSIAAEIDGTSTVVAASTTGFVVTTNVDGTAVRRGQVILTLEDSSDNTWCSSGTLYDGANIQVSAGSKALSATLDRVRLTADGTDTFDAGAINILYE